MLAERTGAKAQRREPSAIEPMGTREPGPSIPSADPALWRRPERSSCSWLFKQYDGDIDGTMAEIGRLGTRIPFRSEDLAEASFLWTLVSEAG